MTKIGSNDSTCDRFYGSSFDGFEGKILSYYFITISSYELSLWEHLYTGVVKVATAFLNVDTWIGSLNEINSLLYKIRITTLSSPTAL